jgi:hypothetical protein
VYVYPKEFEYTLNSTFTVSIKIKDVKDLYAWQLHLLYDKDILEFVEAKEGEFLKPNTFFSIQSTVTGRLQNVACTKKEEAAGVSGEGVLMLVKFKAKNKGTSTLDIRGVKLSDSKICKIPVKVEDARVYVVEKYDIYTPGVGTVPDGVVDIYDLAYVGENYGKEDIDIPADINKDRRVDEKDLILVAYHFTIEDIPPTPAKSAPSQKVYLDKSFIKAISQKEDEIQVILNQEFQIDIVVSQIQELYGIKFKLSYDKDKLKLIEVTAEDTFLKAKSIPLKDNELLLTRIGPIGGVSGKGKLFTLKLQAKSLGKTSLEISGIKFIDPKGSSSPFTIEPENIKLNIRIKSPYNIWDCIVYPNPSKEGKEITFAQLPSDKEVKIRIYTITGEKVRELTKPQAEVKINWDLKNEAQRKVASGIYIYVIDDGKDKKIGKLGVIQ